MVWVRIPNLPMKLFDEAVLWCISEQVGTMPKLMIQLQSILEALEAQERLTLGDHQAFDPSSLHYEYYSCTPPPGSGARADITINHIGLKGCAKVDCKGFFGGIWCL
ncbi:hypothetical protein RJT34_03911 [Clitoria ternatea]|uniref:DUF4283 domain-containing protein n=1 Tax=Clitoria ternatea TaxID=43366 RepID=A0AAN9KMZ9_CLITE